MSMKLIAVILVLSSLSFAGFSSQNPEKSNSNGGEKVIVKEGHRDVVVEYTDATGDGDVNTKVSISPEDPQSTKAAIEDQLSRAAASVAGVAQDVKGKAKEVLSNPTGSLGAGPRELICDSLGNCKHRIARVLSKAKEKAAKAEEEVKEAVEKVKELGMKATHKVEERTEGVRENTREKVREAAERVKEKAGEGVRETGEMARETAEKVKGKAGEVVEETKEKIKEKGKEGKKRFSHVGKRGKEVILDAIGYAFRPKSAGSLMGTVQILGFAMAYGISMWVTFIMSRVLAGMMPRQQFGMVQSKIYPLYFKAMVGSIGLALLGHSARQRCKLFKDKAELLQGVNLVSSLLLVLANMRFFEPRATKVMFKKMKMEKEEGRGRDVASATTTAEVTNEAEPISTTTTTTAALTPPQPEKGEDKSEICKLDHRLKQLNAYSSMLNIATLVALTWHLMYLGDRLALNN